MHSSADHCINEVIIQVEHICLVNSTIKNAKKNLKKMGKIYNNLNLVDSHALDGVNNVVDPFLHTIYYEIWFMFMDEIINIQKDLLKVFECLVDIDVSLQISKIIEQINLLIKPISIPFFICLNQKIVKFKPPQVKLFVPETIYEKF
jgi:hypothetical protein